MRLRLRKRDDVVYRGRRRRRAAVALTFDDGPSEWTPQLLDVLRENGARATFFVLGCAIGGREETLRRTLREGHEVGSHLYDHRDPSLLDDSELAEELERGSGAIVAAAGVLPRLVRPPYGHDARRVARMTASLGLGRVVLGCVDPSDWQSSDPALVVHRMLEGAEPGAIFMLHDGVPPGDGAATQSRAPTVEAVARVVPELIARGYEPVTVSELLL